MTDYAYTEVEQDADAFLASGGNFYYVEVRPPLRDSTAPVVSGVAPAAGTVLAKNDPISFTVTDDADFTLLVSFYIVSADVAEVAWDGDVFESRYFESTRVEVEDGHTYTFRRRGGWPTGGVRLRVRAIDFGGNIGVLV